MHFSAIGNPSFYAVERLRAAVKTTMTAIIPPPPAPVSGSDHTVIPPGEIPPPSAGDGSNINANVGGNVGGNSSQPQATEAKCFFLYEGQVIWNDFFNAHL